MSMHLNLNYHRAPGDVVHLTSRAIDGHGTTPNQWLNNHLDKEFFDNLNFFLDNFENPDNIDVNPYEVNPQEARELIEAGFVVNAGKFWIDQKLHTGYGDGDWVADIYPDGTVIWKN